LLSIKYNINLQNHKNLPAIYDKLLKDELDLLFLFRKQQIKDTLVEQKVSNSSFSLTLDA
jgi:hypothetical protein